MSNNKFSAFLLLFLLSTLMSSCQAIGDIFSAGVWVGVIIVVVIIIVLLLVFGKKS